MNSIVKLCGFKKQEDVEFASNLGANFLGFVFAKHSKRYINLQEFASLNLNGVSSSVVAVFQEPMLDDVTEVLNENRVDFVQIHGTNKNLALEISKIKPVIMAFSGENFTKEQFLEYDFAKYFLFDNANAGSGQGRDFSFAKSIKNLTQKEFFLAGGINIENYKNALQYSNMIDISSGIETISGVKNQEKIKELLQELKNGN